MPTLTFAEKLARLANSDASRMEAFKKDNTPMIATPVYATPLQGRAPGSLQLPRCGRCFLEYESTEAAKTCACWSRCPHCAVTHLSRDEGYTHERTCLLDCGMPQSGFSLAYVRFGVAYLQSKADPERWLYINLAHRGLAPMSTTTKKVAAVWPQLLDFISPADWQRAERPHSPEVRRACGDLLLTPPDEPFRPQNDPFRIPESWEPNTVSYPRNPNYR
jgi:hypothetical protein